MNQLKHAFDRRRGVAMIMVILMGIVVLLLGLTMIATSGGLLQSTVDAKQRIRSRYAAEGVVALQIAKLNVLKDSLMGGSLVLNDTTLNFDLSTGTGEKGKVTSDKGKSATQELITTGTFQGMQGARVPFLIHSTGLAPGGAKTNIDANVYFFQVPIFQFGVFYQGNLEITPGPPMNVQGPVHTNGHAYFRAIPGGVLTFQGPITVTGNIYQWIRSVGSGAPGEIHYYVNPTDPTSQTKVTGPMDVLTQMNTAIPNVAQGSPALNLPIGSATPHDLIMPCTGTETSGLKRQKFDCMIPTGSTARFINGVSDVTARPWINPVPKIFFDRREDRWVKVWDFDVKTALTSSTSKDSIFYLYDGTPNLKDRGMLGDTVINAFRLVNATPLSRNVSIISGNPIYVLGNFNAPRLDGKCRPADDPTTLDQTKFYCNTMIASDALTVLSSNWSANDFAHDGVGIFGGGKTGFGDSIFYATLEQNLSLGAPGSWTGGKPERLTTYADAFGGRDTINAAILTGNKPTNPINIPPLGGDYSEGNFEKYYEGGWHNTIRFLESWAGATLYFRGSFVCMWTQATPGLRTNPIPAYNPIVFSTRYFNPPNRDWGFDTRFNNINNMPPGTPFLSTEIFSNWSERQ